ncbi:MAG: hypothetical protein AB1450_05165 [Pseudomonadota bacterium]
MVPIDMSLDARMMLTRMSLIYQREQGKRAKLSRDEDIVAIINFALHSLNQEYRRYYDAFVGLLTANEIRELVAQGAQIYRGAMVPDQAEAPPAELTAATRTYRGVVQEAPATPAAPAAAAPPEAAPATPARPKRVYRGRVIED